MTRFRAALRHPHAPILILLAALTVLYVGRYLAEAALPGNIPQHPEGWWGWWDQSKYLESTRALRARDLNPDRHWYPMGYALLGAPFAAVWPMHPFFLVNLLALLVAAWGFLGFARRAGVGPWPAAGLFAASVMLDPALFQQWTIPWNTSPTAAALWVLLRLAADHMAGERRPVLLGALVSVVALIRPTDILAAGIVLGAVGLHDLWARPRETWGTVWRAALGGAAVAAVGLALHVAVHGPQPSAYMTWSAQLGFSLHAYGWKAFNLLVAPQPWWGVGQGLLARHPWIGLAFVVTPFAVTRGPAVAALAAAALGQVALYIAYVDLLPTGLWTYLNVHYFKWMGPAFALLAWVGLAQAVAWPRGWPGLAVASAAVLLLLCVRVMPAPAREEARWRGLQIPGPTPGMGETYMNGQATQRDAEGVLRSILDMRLYPVPQGARMFALRRDVVPPVEGLPEGTRGIVARSVLGWPCWLPPAPRACRRLGGA